MNNIENYKSYMSNTHCTKEFHPIPLLSVNTMQQI